jgi:ADP-ribose pyrophosphatase
VKKAAKPKAKKGAKSPRQRRSCQSQSGRLSNPRRSKRQSGKRPKKSSQGREASEAQHGEEDPQRQNGSSKGFLPAVEETAELLSSEIVFDGPLFRVLRDRLVEPGGKLATRDIVRHNGSVVILAIDNAKNKRDPWIVVERQYRHAAGRFLWELPAGKLEPGEDPCLAPNASWRRRPATAPKSGSRWSSTTPAPAFWRVDEGLCGRGPGRRRHQHPDDDEQIAFRLVKLSEILKMIEDGAILDGKTLSASSCTRANSPESAASKAIASTYPNIHLQPGPFPQRPWLI